MGINAIRKVIGSLTNEGKLEGFFTNHNLRRSGPTRLFQAGVDRKLMKEFTGLSLDAIDKYQITSFQQREEMGKILQGNSSDANVSESVQNNVQKDGENVKRSTKLVPAGDNSLEVMLSDVSGGNYCCTCSKKSVKIDETNKVGEVVKSLLEGRRYGKATIKIEIEITE